MSSLKKELRDLKCYIDSLKSKVQSEEDEEDEEEGEEEGEASQDEKVHSL